MSSSRKAPYSAIVEHYEECLGEHGSGPRAVNWKSERDAAIRYDVMLGVVRDTSGTPVILDLGCGLGGLRDHMEQCGLADLGYVGVDISKAFVDAARVRRPDVRFEAMDVLTAPTGALEADYVVMNGVFTRRENLSENEMSDYMASLVTRAFGLAKIGIAFNVMSACVDWKTEALYHPGVALIADLACRLSGHYVLRNDYGLYETTCYVYRTPNPSKDLRA